MPKTQTQLLTPADAARILGVVPATVRAMASRGALRVAVRTPKGNRLFSTQDVLALARSRRAIERPTRSE